MKTVFFDIDTQLDFVSPSGALYAPGAETILPRVAALNSHAAGVGIPVISTMDAHSENDPEFRDWPSHCVAGTLGQRKPQATLLDKRLVIPAARAAPRPIAGIDQIILEKLHVDSFTNPNLEWLLEAVAADRCVVYGVVTEVCVRFAAFGLLKTGREVHVVEDAVRALDTGNGRATLDEFCSAGGRVVSSSSLL